MEADEDACSQCSDDFISLDVFIPELQLQKCTQFSKSDKIWDVKQQIIASLPKELKDSLNYGLFCPPSNGRAGKFLDEERGLGEYSLTGHPPLLELKYKRRVYKMAHLEEKQLKQIHSRANIRRFIEAVQTGNIEKITKLCNRGLDPNFHCVDSGETPLTLASACKQQSGRVIVALINGGALLDYRAKDGHTALHRAVERNNLEAVMTLLDLGASANYRNPRGLTPLYHTVLSGNTDPRLTEALLHDRAALGTVDHQGWQEVHQACKHGLVQHLEHLLYYGADMNARNASGNTPLHVCAVNDQESCARVLLFRGADKESFNFANQSPYQVAVIAGNLSLAEVIRNHRPEDVVPYRDTPQYNPRRRATMGRTHSDPRLELGGKPPSPCPSNCSLPPFSSGSTISDVSSTPASESLTDGSESSGVCSTEADESIILAGMSVICIEDYNVPVEGHLKLTTGDVIEVTIVHSDGLLEGIAADGKEGFFPVSCVQAQPQRVEGRRDLKQTVPSGLTRKWKMYGEPKTVILHKGKKGFGFVLRGAKATSPLMERRPSDNWPSLQYLEDVDIGGIADLAGLRKGDYLMEINGQNVSQASHEHVVNLIRQAGDMIAMTVVTVVRPPAGQGYRQCVTLPRKLTAKKGEVPCPGDRRRENDVSSSAAPTPPRRDPRTTLTMGRTRARSMVAGLAEIEALDRTLNDYDSEGRSTKSSSVESISARTAANSEDGSTKVASIRSRPSSRRITPQELEAFFDRQEGKPVIKSAKVFGSVAAMKRSKASRVSKVASFMRQLHKNFHSTPDLNAENEGDTRGQRCYSQEDLPNSRHSWAVPSWRALDDKIYAQTLPVKKRASCPPPTHPPPPPPVGQMITVDVSKSSEEYANMQTLQEENTVMSSFRPGDSAKLYASPESIVSVAYMADNPPTHYSPGVRSRSVPPTSHNSETETSGDSGVANMMTLRSRQRDSMSTDSGHVSDKGTLKKTKAPVYTPQFERTDSDSPARIPQYRNPEPFIPEPDYESSEDDELPQDHSSSLSTFGKTDSVIEIVPASTEAAGKSTKSEIDEQIEALSEAQKACKEAKERLKHAKMEKSEKITESKATQSEIDSPIKLRPMETAEHKEEPKELPPPPPPSHKEASQQTVKTDPRAIVDPKSKENIQHVSFQTKEMEKKGPARDHSPTMRSRRKKDGLRIALTGAQIKLGSNSEGAHLPLRIPPNCPKGYFQEEMERYENSSSGVSSDIEIERACQNGRMDPGMWNRRNRTLPKHMYQPTPLVNASKNRGASPRRDPTKRYIRLQVDSVGRAGINEVDVLTQLVPPPPEFSEAIAPPPGFSDDTPPLRLQSVDAMRYMYSKDFQHPRTSTLQPTRSSTSSTSSPSGKIYPEYASTSTMTSHRALKSSSQQKSFRLKALHMWTEKDVCDWLESLYLPEYRGRFAEAGITGPKLARMDNNDLVGLGVRQVGHRINMERSLRRYLTASTAQ